jgi:hypothetical protein
MHLHRPLRQSMPLANRLEVPGLEMEIIIATTAVVLPFRRRRFSNPIPLPVAVVLQVPRRISRDEVSRPQRMVSLVAAPVLA